VAENVVEIIIRAKDEATAKLKDVSSALSAMDKALIGIGSALTASATAISVATVAGARRADELNEMAQKIGLSVNQISRLELVVKTSGSSIEALSVAFRNLQKNITFAAEGSTEAEDALARLGLSFQQLRVLDPEQQLLRVADGLAGIPDPAARAAAAVALLGRSGTDLLPAFSKGAAGIQELTEKADRLGITVDQLQAALGDKLSDEVATLNLQVNALKTSLVVGLAPALIVVAQAAQTAFAGLIGFTRENPAIIRDVTSLAAQLGVASLSMVGLGRAISGVLPALAGLVTALGLGSAGAVVLATSLGIAGVAIAIFAAGMIKARNETEKKLAFNLDVKDIETAQQEIDRLTKLREKLQDAIKPIKTTDILGITRTVDPTEPFKAFGNVEGIGRVTGQRAKELVGFLDQQIAAGERIKEQLAQQEALRKALADLAGKGVKLSDEELKKLIETTNAVAQLRASVQSVADIRDIRLGISAESDADLTATRLKLEDLIARGKDAASTLALIKANVAVDGVTESIAELQKIVDKAAIARDALDIVGTVKVKVDVEPLDPGALRLPLDVDAEELNAFLGSLGLTDESIVRIVERVAEFKESMGGLGETGADAIAGLAAGFEAFAALAVEKFSLVTEIARSTFEGMQDFALSLSDSFGELFVGIAVDGQNAFESIGDFAVEAGKLVRQLIRELISAFVRALALRAVLSILSFGAATPLTIVGGGIASRGGSVPMLAAGGSVAALAAGGMIGSASIAWPHAAFGLQVVPGAISKRDSVPALLAPGEVVLPTVDGRSPAPLLGDLAQLKDVLKAGVAASPDRKRERSITFNVSAYDATTFRDSIRHGHLREEDLRAADLGR
jgi:hypothetical protein